MPVMPAPSRIVLCYSPIQEHAYLPEAIAFANAYWERAADGAFVRTTSTLQDEAEAVFGERTNIRQIANIVATAYAVDIRCPSCGAVATIDGRHALMRLEKARAAAGDETCTTCQSAKQKADDDAAAASRATKVRQHLDSISTPPTQYEHLPFNVCLIALALQGAIGDRFVSGTPFNIHWVENIWGGAPEVLLTILYEHGVIEPSTDPANLAKMDLRADGVLAIPWEDAEWQTRPQANSDRREAMLILNQRTIADAHLVADLWYENSVAEGLRYMKQQAAFRGLVPPSQEDEVSIQRSLYDALTIYPLSKIWSAIWRVVCTAESECACRKSTPELSSRAMPRNLERLMNDARRGKASLNKAWERPTYLPMSHLTAVFEEKFGLNHNSTSLDARSAIEDAERRCQYQANLDQYRTILNDLIGQAQTIGITTEVMFMYGDCLRHNLGIDGAIEAIRTHFPALAANQDQIEKMA